METWQSVLEAFSYQSQVGYGPTTLPLRHSDVVYPYPYLSIYSNTVFSTSPCGTALAFAPAPDLPPEQNRAVAVCLFIYGGNVHYTDTVVFHHKFLKDKLVIGKHVFMLLNTSSTVLFLLRM